MQNSRSRFRSRRRQDHNAPLAERIPTQTLNGRWTGHPALEEAVTRATLEAVLKSQREDGQDD